MNHLGSLERCFQYLFSVGAVHAFNLKINTCGDCFCFEPQLVVLRPYFCLCTQVSLLVVFRELCVVPELEAVACMINT